MKCTFKSMRKYCAKRYLAALLLFTPTIALADSGTFIDTVLQNLLNYLTSTPARILAVIAIVGVGYSTWHLGKIPKDKAIAIIVGIGIVFGGTTIAKMLGVGV